MRNLRNQVQLIGRLGIDPEVKTFGEGKKVVRFSLATTEIHKNAKGEKVEETQWHQIVCWNGQATIAENYLKKGKEVLIDGKLSTRKWEVEGQPTKYFTEIIADEILLLGGKEN